MDEFNTNLAVSHRLQILKYTQNVRNHQSSTLSLRIICQGLGHTIMTHINRPCLCPCPIHTIQLLKCISLSKCGLWTLTQYRQLHSLLVSTKTQAVGQSQSKAPPSLPGWSTVIIIQTTVVMNLTFGWFWKSDTCWNWTSNLLTLHVMLYPLS